MERGKRGRDPSVPRDKGLVGYSIIPDESRKEKEQHSKGAKGRSKGTWRGDASWFENKTLLEPHLVAIMKEGIGYSPGRRKSPEGKFGPTSVKGDKIHPNR